MRALIVDDSPTARAQVRSALEDVQGRLGIALDVAEASGGLEALRALSTDVVDVLIVDLQMPTVSGLEVLSFWKGRGQGRAMRAFVMSTDVSSLDRSRLFEAGAHVFLEKPVTVEGLAEGLRALAPSAAPTSAPPSSGVGT